MISVFFLKTIEQHEDDVLAITQRYIDHEIIFDKNKCIYVEQEIEFLGLEIKARQIILQKTYFRKIKKILRKSKTEDN